MIRKNLEVETSQCIYQITDTNTDTDLQITIDPN